MKSAAVVRVTTREFDSGSLSLTMDRKAAASLAIREGGAAFVLPGTGGREFRFREGCQLL
ncbi:MAG TPA: hypothetical protein VG206_11395 [Terriglobia bacterium]|nr:hypothetical protein [Terriglobia bacterium]